MSSATIIAVTGITVSGIVGPFVATWGHRRADRQRFEREQLRRRREDLRAVLDQGAVLLGAGQTNLRLAHEAVSRGEAEPADVRDWASEVHLLGQRLLLRLSNRDPVVVKYEQVRAALVSVGESYGDEAAYSQTVDAFEARRSEFLEEARAALGRSGDP